MSSISHKDSACLLNIIESISKIKQYTESYSDADALNDDTKSFDAVMMNFIVIGEMADKLSPEFRDSTDSQIDWLKIRGLRNIIAHNYFGIDAEEVWQIIHDSLLELAYNIEQIISQYKTLPITNAIPLPIQHGSLERSLVPTAQGIA